MQRKEEMLWKAQVGREIVQEAFPELKNAPLKKKDTLFQFHEHET